MCQLFGIKTQKRFQKDLDIEIVHQIGYTQIKILFKMPQKMSVTKVFFVELGLTQHCSLLNL